MTRFHSVCVTGCAGFLGSHLAEYYLEQGCQVVGVDNLITGNMENIAHLQERYGGSFLFQYADVADFAGITGFDLILHFASPASPNTNFPSSYFSNPRMTIHANVNATEKLIFNMRKDCRFIFASTSEIYGDPEITPQPESYTGNVNPVSRRSIYDESKRMGETITSLGHWRHGLNTGIVRIFNTYGERIPDDGRVISNFIGTSLGRKQMQVYGGSQTRSFLYISDLIDGVVKLAESDFNNPINIGSCEEIPILHLAHKIGEKAGFKNMYLHSDDKRECDDPQRRQADTTLAQKELGWQETVSLDDGLDRTIEWYKEKTNSK